MFTRGFAPLVVACGLLGCASVPLDQVRQQAAQRKSCCVSFADLPYRQLLPSRREEVALSESSPVFAFASGPAPFQAFALPASSAPRTLTIQAMSSGGFLPTATYVDPVVHVLDEERKQVATFSSLRLEHGRHTILPGLFAYYHGTTLELPVAARFVVVQADMFSSRRQSSVSENGTVHRIPAAAYGTVYLILS
jgi:hypothetical protein